MIIPTEPLRIFVGTDPRQLIAFNVLASSIMRHASVPVAVTPLVLRTLPMKRRGLTEFTFARYLVPWLCGYRGRGVFMDADMVVTGDVAELFAAADGMAPVSVMQQQPRFEWPSLMVFNAAMCRRLTPEWIDDAANDPASLEWAHTIGTLPPEWNHCVGLASPIGDVGRPPKLLHFTEGVPCWPETTGTDSNAESIWQAELRAMNSTVSWRELMGSSVHARRTLPRYLKRKYGLEVA